MIGELIPGKKVNIIGGGFAGLTLAYRLKQAGVPFTLYERSHLGGKIVSRNTPYGPLEAAASSLYMNLEAEKFIQDLGIPYLTSQKKLKRRIWLDGAFKSPVGPGLLSRLMLKLSCAVPEITEQSTVEEIFAPLLGKKYMDELLSCALQGIYASEARDLNFLSLYPFAEGKQFANYFSFLTALRKELSLSRAHEIKGSISFPGGMQSLTDLLSRKVQEHVKPMPETFDFNDNIAICTPAPEAARLLRDYAPEISEELAKIEYRPMSSLTIMMKTKLQALNGCFGVLVPQKYAKNILGILNQSEMFPANYKAHCYSIICKNELPREQILHELRTIAMDFTEDQVLESSLQTWKSGLPIYGNPRYQALKNIKASLKDRPGLVLFGNYTSGISLRAMIEATTKSRL